MAEPNFYAIIPATVRYDKDLPSTAKLLYAEISALTNKEGYCFATNKYFADLYSVSERQISDLIGKMAKTGYIKVEIKKGVKRKIYLCETQPTKKTSIGIEENFHTTIEENFHHNNTSINNKNNNTYTSEFESWYARYPNKFNKGQTFKNWNAALKKYSVEDLNKALRNYENYISSNHVRAEYITRSTNFLGRKGEFIGWLEKDEAPTITPAEMTRQSNGAFEERMRRFGNAC